MASKEGGKPSVICGWARSRGSTGMHTEELEGCEYGLSRTSALACEKLCMVDRSRSGDPAHGLVMFYALQVRKIIIKKVL